MEKNNRIEELVPFTFILSVFVVIIHNSTGAYFEYGNSMSSNIIHYFIHELMPLLTSCAVPSFFIISSFLFYRNFTQEMAYSKLHSRLKSLVIPYFIWNTYGLVVAMLFHMPMIKEFTADQSNPFELNMIIEGVLLFRYSPFWFVFALILYNSLCMLVYNLGKSKVFSPVLWGVLYIVLGYNHFKHPFVDYGYVCNVFDISSLLYYLLGAYLGINYPNVMNVNYVSRQRFFALFAFVGISILQIFFNIDKTSFWFPLLIIVKSVSLWIILKTFCKKIAQHWWLKISFFVYAIHTGVQKIICTIVRLVICKLVPFSSFKELICWILSVFLTMAFIVIVAKIWLKYSTKTFTFCTGGRI